MTFEVQNKLIRFQPDFVLATAWSGKIQRSSLDQSEYGLGAKMASDTKKGLVHDWLMDANL